MKVELAGHEDIDSLLDLDPHITRPVMERKLRDQEVILMRNDRVISAYLRYSLFWDSIPFINMLMVDEPLRRQGIGSQLVQEWEVMMTDRGFDRSMTSSQEDEDAQHFWRKIGYRDVGSFKPFGESNEIIFMKVLSPPIEKN